MYQTMNLSHAEAQEMIAAIQKKVEAEHKAAAIAVTDSHGELIAFLRMDGCHLPPLTVAINKAFTAARERRESGEVGQASRTQPFPMTNYGDLRYTGWAGGFPVLHEGKVVGAIGISGLDEELEGELGRMAVELITRKQGR
ncbi:MAG TPA: heme-binding protein [Spirochaetia bacterium]|nr:heme-binding protein [Spirochaetia bacterium]